ncbi:hypothetical protein BDK51DRAFT_30911 [Blyttiomyces helicus]|uniref:Uncharacterized protein n=1 Tax=Blyttiomyces helicus TaxID=388810 RepID=A0A4P9WED9_9FUNG|nr:hypothetical protein BDK51DRAFT_30911 [Blyttiomyces helicus]|eukprot:RKO91081.1 hypothetical protein BDK51DRAFT_30911 [Blyttiomyces helicus]
MAPHRTDGWSTNCPLIPDPPDAFAAPEDAGFLNFSHAVCLRVVDDPANVARANSFRNDYFTPCLDSVAEEYSLRLHHQWLRRWQRKVQEAASAGGTSGHGDRMTGHVAIQQGRRPLHQQRARSSYTGPRMEHMRKVAAHRMVITRYDDPESDSESDGENVSSAGEDEDWEEYEVSPGSAEISFFYLNPQYPEFTLTCIFDNSYTFTKKGNAAIVGKLLGSPGNDTLEQLEMRWSPGESLQLRKTGDGYDGEYIVSMDVQNFSGIPPPKMPDDSATKSYVDLAITEHSQEKSGGILVYLTGTDFVNVANIRPGSYMITVSAVNIYGAPTSTFSDVVEQWESKWR